jgi:peptide/nickel transport system substrate-binding protein
MCRPWSQLPMPHRTARRRLPTVVFVAGALVIAGCSSSSSGGANNSSTGKTAGSSSTTAGAFGTLPPASGTPIKGGTITYPITSGAQPTWIMPIYPEAQFTAYNLSFETPMWRTLYMTTVGNRPILNPTVSLAAAPIYSNGDKTVTINMDKTYKWSANGAPVDAKDVLFWIAEERAAVKENPNNFGSYSKGNFPDNVVSATAPSTYQVVLTLDKAYNPSWYTYTQLNTITPLPSTSWAKASPTGPQLDYNNPANAKKIYDFLAAQSKQIKTYATNPLWQDVDGPFKLTSFNTTTDANTMVPNPTYGGPQKAVFSTLKAEYFASTTAEVNAVLAGQLSLAGPLPGDAIPQVPTIKRLGYNVYGYPSFAYNYVVFNFKDTTNNWDKVIGQLYVRQALAHLSDQAAIIQGVYHGAAAPDYGPVPAIPSSNYTPSNAATNPYPFSTAAAAQLLSSHGWKVVPGGTTTCQDPGTAANQCGAGIPAGQNLNFTDYFTNDPADSGLETTQLASDAAKVGIKVTPAGKTFDYIVEQYDDPVTPSNNNKWQVELYGGFTDNDYPTQDTIFNTTGNDNEGDYSDATADRLILASKFSPNPSAVKNEAAYLTKNLPAIFLPNQDLLFAWKGISGPPDSFANLTQYGFTPEYWYLTSK